MSKPPTSKNKKPRTENVDDVDAPRERPIVDSKLLAKQRSEELRAYGFNACMSLFRSRPEDIIKVYLTEERSRSVSDLLKWCAKNRKAYRTVPNDDLEKLASTVHHEGICIVAKKPKTLDASTLDGQLIHSRDDTTLVLIEGVQNPHNLGAILRVCAHFGARALLTVGEDSAEISGAALRTSEGGAESVPIVHLEDPFPYLENLKKQGFTIYATQADSKMSLFREIFPHRSVLMFGSEHSGLSSRLLKVSDKVLSIPGTHAVESLNVACSAAIVLGEHWRRRVELPKARKHRDEREY